MLHLQHLKLRYEHKMHEFLFLYKYFVIKLIALYLCFYYVYKVNSVIFVNIHFCNNVLNSLLRRPFFTLMLRGWFKILLLTNYIKTIIK